MGASFVELVGLQSAMALTCHCHFSVADSLCWLHGQPGASVAGDHWHPLEIYGRALEIN